MIAVDTNILVYAHNKFSKYHETAKAEICFLAESSIRWGIPLHCIGEFLRVITHRKVFENPFTVDEAVTALNRLLESPSLKLLYPTSDYLSLLSVAMTEVNATGNLVHDAQIVAVCRGNGVTALLTEDRDFDLFTRFRTKHLNFD
ncbi:MAG: PIN domain-containing protein [Acidiferrobacterales bacterium]|nr:PIN domain-containing protein [Acidiferrobacterales bacterium]